MPSRNEQGKMETRVDKVGGRKAGGRSKSAESSARGGAKDVVGASQARNPSGGQPRWESTLKGSEGTSLTAGGVSPQWIPVLASIGVPLMPTRPRRARRLVESGRAVGKWKAGIYHIRMLDRDVGEVQPIAVGIDPGSKREGFTVKSERHTYLNILSDAVTDVKDRVEARRNVRRARRSRKTPCRANRENRARGGIPPSTKARWQAKLRIVNILYSLYPVKTWVVEDIKAKTRRGGKRWNISFSPLEVGKGWFYGEMMKRGELALKSGWDTKCMRDALGLVKTNGKMEERFSAHNVDSWVLAHSSVGGNGKSDNESIWRMVPLRFHRRQLHYFQPSSGGIRRAYGGTMSLGLKRGSLVRHPKWGTCYVGGNMGEKISLHQLTDGERVCRSAKKSDLKVLRFGSWRYSKVA